MMGPMAGLRPRTSLFYHQPAGGATLQLVYKSIDAYANEGTSSSYILISLAAYTFCSLLVVSLFT